MAGVAIGLDAGKNGVTVIPRAKEKATNVETAFFIKEALLAFLNITTIELPLKLNNVNKIHLKSKIFIIRLTFILAFCLRPRSMKSFYKDFLMSIGEWQVTTHMPFTRIAN
ncbi:hypothetical protein EX87_01480 [Brevibacillus laterosporus]|uniref:Uncharacterized protein n=1 Tax=Brevibacillus laterosporus TaxID=1465 RepID=A0A0F7BY91_BRELA|nr:hypothetical protein EX87_01480 [Brevibacillus laterosporus]